MDITEKVIELAQQVPSGRVTTFGDVARALGDVLASKAVFQISKTCWKKAPFYRIVKADGSIGSLHCPADIEKLRKEGLLISEGKIADFERVVFSDFTTEYPLKAMREEQMSLAKKVVVEDDYGSLRNVTGFDSAYADDKAFGAAVTMDTEKMEVVEQVTSIGKVNFPYIPTYLSYREFPLIEMLFGKLTKKPSCLMIDGNGILHPIGLGLASYVGLKLGIPTIGVAKSLLLGRVERMPTRPGDYSLILYKGEKRGFALKSSDSNKMIYVSPGHRISLQTSLDIAKRLCRYRVPEPLRLAHIESSALRKSMK